MQRGLGKIRRRDGCLSNRNLYPAGAGGGLRFDPKLAVPNQDQQAPFCPGIFHRDSHELLDQLGKNHLTRNRLRRFHDSLDVQLPDRRANRGRRGGSSFLAQARIPFVELLYFSVGAPTVIAVPRVAEMGVAGRFQTLRQAVLRRQFVGEALVLNEAVLARQMDRLLIQTQCVGVPFFDAGDLGQNQRVLVGESRWVVFGPLAQLFLVRRQEFAPRLLLIGPRGFIERRHR